MVCEAFIQPFDFECILLNLLSGSPVIFLVLIFLGLIIGAAYFRMTSIILGLFILGISVVFASVLGTTVLWWLSGSIAIIFIVVSILQAFR
jgi:hypothetical protein